MNLDLNIKLTAIAKFMNHPEFDSYSIDHQDNLLGKLDYHKSFDSLMEVIKKINTTHNDGNPHRDLMYTMNYLLGGGYKFGNNYKLDSVIFSLDNLFNRASEFIIHYNINLL